MKIRKYFELANENRRLKGKNADLRDMYKGLLNDVETLLANIESTSVQNNYNNTNYKSHKIIELVRDFQDTYQL